jgi:hypothetical protein
MENVMKLMIHLTTVVIVSAAWHATTAGSPYMQDGVREEVFPTSNGLTIRARMEGPKDADTPLQVVCYFRHKPAGDKTLGAAVELDKALGGVVASLRDRGEFVGDDLETLLIAPPKDSIKPRMLLLVGLGDEDSLSPERMERVGRVALREASRLGVRRVAFAPLIRDQGNSKIGVGEVGRAVVRGFLLAHDTERRLQREGLSKGIAVEEWSMEAGPVYFDETITGIREAIKEADAAIGSRASAPYRSR